MDERPVALSVESPLARITLNRPDVLNTENLAWVEALGAAVDAVAAEPPRHERPRQPFGGSGGLTVGQPPRALHGEPALRMIPCAAVEQVVQAHTHHLSTNGQETV